MILLTPLLREVKQFYAAKGYDATYSKWMTNFYALLQAHGAKKSLYELEMLKGRDKLNAMRWQNLIDKLRALQAKPEEGKSQEQPAAESEARPKRKGGSSWEEAAPGTEVAWETVPISLETFHPSVYIAWEDFDASFEARVKERMALAVEKIPWLSKVWGVSGFCSSTNILMKSWTPGVFGQSDQAHRIIKMPAAYFSNWAGVQHVDGMGEHFGPSGVKYITGSDSVSFFFHEFGHCVLGWLEENLKEVDLRPDLQHQFLVLAVNGDLADLSNYSLAGDSEYFAEAFVAYIEWDETQLAQVPFVTDLFSDLGGLVK